MCPFVHPKEGRGSVPQDARVIRWVIILGMTVGMIGLLTMGGLAVITDASDGIAASHERTEWHAQFTESSGSSVMDDTTVESLNKIVDGQAYDVAEFALPPGTETGAIILATYSRLNGVSPLEHDLRDDIHQLVMSAPGIFFGIVSRRSNQSTSTVRYHTRILEREGLIVEELVWGKRRLFPVGTDDDDYELFAAIQDELLSEVIAAIARNEPIPVGDLAEVLDRAPSTVSHHLSRLEEGDLINRERQGQSVHVSLTDRIKDVVSIDAHGITISDQIGRHTPMETTPAVTDVSARVDIDQPKPVPLGPSIESD